MMLKVMDLIIAQMEKKYKDTNANLVGDSSLLITSGYLPSLLTRTAQNAIAAIQLKREVL
jgi:hypothetical protein